LPNDWQPTNARDDREQVTKAREAAEAEWIDWVNPRGDAGFS